MGKKITVTIDDEDHRLISESCFSLSKVVQRGVKLAIAELRSVQSPISALAVPAPTPSPEPEAAPVAAPQPAPKVEVPPEPPKAVAAPVAPPAPVAVPKPKAPPAPPAWAAPPDAPVHAVEGVKWVDASWACSQLGIDTENLLELVDDEDTMRVGGVQCIDSLGITTLVGLANDGGSDPKKTRAFERWYETL